MCCVISENWVLSQNYMVSNGYYMIGGTITFQMQKKQKMASPDAVTIFLLSLVFRMGIWNASTGKLHTQDLNAFHI